MSCRIGSSLARYFLVKQGLSASRLTLCDSKVTHAPTVSPRGVSDHLFHGCHGQLGHMSLFMTSLLVIHEYVAVKHFILLSKGLIAIFEEAKRDVEQADLLMTLNETYRILLLETHLQPWDHCGHELHKFFQDNPDH